MGKSKKPPKRPRQKTVSFRLPDDLVEQMRVLAEQNRRTLSGEVQMAFEKHLSSNGFGGETGEKNTLR
jgi:hypothetical protein